LLRSAIAELLICAGPVSAHEGAIEVMGHAIGAPEGEGRICGSGNLPVERVITAADGGILRSPASSCRGQVLELLAGGLVFAEMFLQPQAGAGSRMVPGADASRPCGAGTTARASGVAMGMTQQYLAGELSVLLERVQTVTTTEAAGRDASTLRQAAETEPVQALGWVTVRALALTDRLCWDSLNRGDIAAFSRQAAAGAALREFGVCAGLLRDA